MSNVAVDNRYDRLLDALDHERLSRLSFIGRALALGVGAAAIGTVLAELPSERAVDAASRELAPATLTYWTLPPDNPKQWAEGEGAIITLFEQAYPQVHIAVQQIPFSDYATKLSTAARAGASPDIGRVNHPDLESYAGAGWLLPLDSYIASSTIVTPKDYYPGFYAVTRYKGKQYALPTDTDNRCLFYNRDIFKKAGLVDGAGNAQPPRTWAEMLHASAQIQAKVKGVYPIALSIGQAYGMSYQSLGNFMVTNGGYLLSQTGKPRANAANDMATVQAWNWLWGQLYLKQQAFAPGATQTDISAESALFAHGVVAMVHDGPWVRPEAINRNMVFGRNYATAGTPVRVSGQHAAGSQGGWLMSIFRDSKNQLAAWRFLEFLQRPTINAMWCSAQNALPARAAVFDKKPFVGDPFWNTFRAQLPYSRPPITPLVPQTPAIANILDVVTTQVLLGKMPLSQGLRSFDNQVNALLH